MARGKKRKRGRSWKKQTPKHLREVWDIVEGAPQVAELPIRLGGHEIASYQELLAAYEANPRLVSMDLERWIEKTYRKADKSASEAEAEHRRAEQELTVHRGASEMADRLKGAMSEDELTPEKEAALKEIMGTSPEEGEQILGMLDVISKIQEATGRQARIGEVADRTGLEDQDVLRLANLAERAGFATTEGTKLSFNESITQQRAQPATEKLWPSTEGSLAAKGMISMPTATVQHFAAIAREEGLPLAPTEEAVMTLAPLARHIVVDSKVRQTEEGHNYVRAELICGCRAIMTKDPEMGKYAGRPLRDLAEHLTDADLPPALAEIRKSWAERGWLEELTNGEWRWRDQMEEVDRQIGEWELQKLDVQELAFDFPLRQFGLLVESGNTSVPDEDGVEMPIHGGARSFEPIWRRQAAMVESVRQEGTRWKATAEEEVRTRASDPFDPKLIKSFLVPPTPWTGRAIAASGVLANLRDCRTVAVDMDVSEGLPDWESPEEAWEYADEAELPFPVTYFDFTTPGGYRPKVVVRNAHKDRGDLELTLRAAICWKMDGYLTISPFVWFAEGDNDPDDLRNRTDYDSPGALHFGLSDRLRRQMADGRKINLDEDMDPITHARVTSPLGISGPSQVVLTTPIFGMPGWVDLFSELSETDEAQQGQLLNAEAMITAAAACRVLSVIYALDGTVNIELVEGEPERRERREVERAQKKGKVAEISMTVRIHPTKQDEREPSDREVKREYSHAFYRRGHFAHYPIGTRMADRMAEEAPTKLVNHPVKGLCRKIYRKPTIVGRIGADGEEREPIAKSYVWGKAKKRASL